jgi:ubiquinone biosynthesis protein
MLPQELTPTRLVRTSQRPKVVIEEPRAPGRFRTLFFLFHLVRLGATALWLRLTWRLTATRFAGHARGFFLRLDTVGVKLARTLAMRSDLLPAELAAELATFSERGTGVPFTTIQRTLQEELGVPLERHFDDFETEPFAATTGFQLHRAHLRREQVWVVVKILRPGIEDTSARDLVLLRRVTGWLQALAIYPKMRWVDLFREVEDVSTRELDLRFEAAALQQLARTLPAHGVHVPEVFLPYSTRRVLVMEFIHAALLADYVALKDTDPKRLANWLEENNIQPRKLARRLFHSVWRQIFEDNFFHADLNPYNVILLRNNRLGIIDCRSVGQLEADSLAKHRRFVEAIADGEYATAAEYSFLLAFRLPKIDLGEVKAEFVRVWRRWESRNYVRELPAQEKSITGMIDALSRIMYRHRFETQWSLARFGATVVNGDASVLQLASDVNYVHWLRDYFRGAKRRSQRFRLADIANRSVNTVASFVELPKTISAISMIQQEILRRQARVFQGSTTKTGYFLATMYSFLASGLLLLGALFACALLDQHYAVPLEPVLGPQLTALVTSLPKIGYWLWAGVVVAAFYLLRRMVLAKRGYLQQDDIRRREAGPTI